jgi:chaperone required for assembly of F1-ATPase
MGSASNPAQTGSNASHDPRLYLDQTSNRPNAYRQQMLGNVLTDTVCYWADPATDYILYGRQEKVWKDLYARIESTFGETLAKVMVAPDCMIMGRSTVTA